ncbi:SDR family NAD(P)-dependent oxidoreductase [Devosia nitrariae]|uniref:Short-chain dehydrogenase n=1 Tax=Devosia nitrariae TaxID=2071872 RepID=A0ABQ5W7L9_9HYPH|nr:SDR family NAD(P)-dependent oxidoreductase [Devosia nitrariae]GLQ55971.1 short-chain dehydrogenase [Devosia nitrariae]
MLPFLKSGETAVITGAASGIGRATAERLSHYGLNLVLIDSDDALLNQAASELETANDGAVVGIVADVSDAQRLNSIAADVFSRFGSVSFLMNNAGVHVPSSPWGDRAGWEKMLAVNLWGVFNGLEAFVPQMSASGHRGWIVNTGSKEGITTPPGNVAYSVSKAGVKVLTEQLEHELRSKYPGQLTAHLLVPGYTFTGMHSRRLGAIKPEAAWTSDQVVTYMLDRLEEGAFYIICPDNEVSSELDRTRITWAAEDMTQGRPALSRWHPDYKDAFIARASDKT